MCREGVDTLKINPSGDEFVPFARAHQTVMNEAEVAAVAEVAKSRGKMLAAHCRSAESVKMALRHGVDVLYHCTLSDAEALDMLEAHKDRIFVAPAMGIMYATAVGEGSGYGITKDHPVAIYFKRELDMCIENMKKLKKRGVRILPGGDYGFAWNPIGTNARDIEHFVKLLDFTPMDAIIAATKLGGEIMGMGNELGQIKAGLSRRCPAGGRQSARRRQHPARQGPAARDHEGRQPSTRSRASGRRRTRSPPNSAPSPPMSAPAGPPRRLRLGMVGGGRGAFIGEAHRIAARLDDRYELVAGALSLDPHRAIESGRDLRLDPTRCYTDAANGQGDTNVYGAQQLLAGRQCRADEAGIDAERGRQDRQVAAGLGPDVGARRGDQFLPIAVRRARPRPPPSTIASGSSMFTTRATSGPSWRAAAVTMSPAAASPEVAAANRSARADAATRAAGRRRR